MASSSNNLNLNFIKTKRGRDKLLRAGHQYHKNMTNKDGSVIWRCVNREHCNGSLTTSKSNQIIRENTHVCEPNFHKNKIDEVLQKCKLKVQETFEAIPTIYEKCFEELETSDSDGPEIPDFHSKADALYNSRKKILNVSQLNYKSIDEVEIPIILSEKFMIHKSDHDNNVFIFATSDGLKLLQEADLAFVDGTFFTTPDPFCQLFSFHVDTGSSRESVSIIPVVFCLLPNKQQVTYEKLFTVLKENFSVCFSFLKCDYEIAVINAAKTVFPNIKIKGCLFHLYKAISKKGKELGMLDVKNKANVVWDTINLALLPKQFIPEAWLTISEKASEFKEFEQFQAYFTGQWLKKINIDMWCCSQERHRTTNSLERWHRKLKSKLIAHSNNLFMFLQTLKREAIYYQKKIRKETVGTTLKKRRSKEIIKDAKIDKIIDNLMKGKITIEKCLQQLRWAKY